MRLIRLVFLLFSGFISAAAPLSPSAPVPNWQHYPAFWVWGGVDKTQIPATAQRLYILQGSIQSNRQAVVRFQRQGALVQAFDVPLFLVYRFEILTWNVAIQQSILHQIQYWESHGQQVLGIQIDFDAQTQRLAHYEQFLRQVRAALPRKYQLSITGLLDWSQNASPTVLQTLADSLDEVIFQTYQGKHTIPYYQAYLKAFAKLQIPFKIGIVAGGVWDVQNEQWLAELPFYRGVVVFLLPSR